MNLNQPFGFQSVMRLWPIYLQGEYKFDNARVTPLQVTQSTESYGGRFGIFLNNKKDSELSGVAIHAGVLNREEYKKIIFTTNEYPRDPLGNEIQVDQFQVHTKAFTYVFGISVLQIMLDDGEKLKALADDFDLQVLKKRKRFSTISLTLEAMYQPKTVFSQIGVYNPYNFYVDKELTFVPEFKHKKMGVNLRMDYSGPLHVGVFMQMGVFPGIMHKSDDYLDFNFVCRAGALMNFGIFKKNEN